MANVTFEISTEDNDHAINAFNWTARAVEWADEVGPMIRESIRKEAPVRTGRLRDSVRYERETHIGSVDLKFHATTPYTRYVIKGTRPHEIHANAALALHFHDSHGQEVFAKFVHHPGTKPNDFPKRGYDAVEAAVRKSFHDKFTKDM